MVLPRIHRGRQARNDSFVVLCPGAATEVRLAFNAPAVAEPAGLEGINALACDFILDRIRRTSSETTSVVWASRPGYFGPVISARCAPDGAIAVLAALEHLRDESPHAAPGPDLERLKSERRAKSLDEGHQIRAAVQSVLFDDRSRARLPSDGPGSFLNDVQAEQVQDVVTNVLSASETATVIAGRQMANLVPNVTDEAMHLDSSSGHGARFGFPVSPAQLGKSTNTIIESHSAEVCRLLLFHEVPGPLTREWELLHLIRTYLVSSAPGSIGSALRTQTALSYGTSVQLAEFGERAAWVIMFTVPYEDVARAVEVCRLALERVQEGVFEGESVDTLIQHRGSQILRQWNTPSGAADELIHSWHRHGRNPTWPFRSFDWLEFSQQDLTSASSTWLRPREMNVIAIGEPSLLQSQLQHVVQ
jgi:hypothetical protein